VLLSLQDEDLALMGINHSLHRRAALFAIQDLIAAVKGEGSLATASPVVTTAEVYDVFISYRRVGGADFAHLLKLCLTAMGLHVFLDVENLGQGKFDDKLIRSLQCSNNVLLVWTKGCMDRFLDGEDSQGADFVRMEYALSLKHRKNIVPVYKEDFQFPTEDQLPVDVKGILSYNAIKFIGEYREASLGKIKKSLVLV
jgi:TIR domain